MIRTLRRSLAGLVLAGGVLCLAAAPASAQSVPAKQLFSKPDLPSAMRTESIGFYAKGCLAGAVPLPIDGPTWQVMRLSRNRHWGTPALVSFLERLSKEAASLDNWPGLLVGDMSQPRGGPMPSGHASHQVGLDADIWLTPMPASRLSAAQRESLSARSVLKKGAYYVVDDRIWSPAYTGLIKLAAEDPKVQRIFVNPGIKKKLCDTVRGDRGWLNKVRPFWGHDEHFHVRLYCQPGSPECESQQTTGTGDGCGKALDWWFDVGLKPPPPNAKPAKPKPPLTMAQLPKACRAVLDAPAARSEAAAIGGERKAFGAPALSRPMPPANIGR